MPQTVPYIKTAYRVKSKSILFFYTNYTSFVRTDFEILSSVYTVRKYQFKPVTGLVNTAVELIKQFWFLALNIWKCDAVFTWFADYHSLLPVLFAGMARRKSFVVIGGYEVCRIKELNYGALCSRFRGFFCVKSMQWCSLNLTVSKYTDRKVKYLAPSSNRQLVPNCVDFVLPADRAVKEDLVLTVGIIDTKRSFLLKGIDTFMEVAAQTPAYKFVIVGLDTFKLADLVSDLPPNVTIYARMPHDELPGWYSRARFYCQLSRSESFGVSIAESMLYACIPIVTSEGGMPELVGDAGYIVRRDAAVISHLISGAAAGRPGLESAGVKRIVENFSRSKRGETLVKCISNS